MPEIFRIFTLSLWEELKMLKARPCKCGNRDLLIEGFRGEKGWSVYIACLKCSRLPVYKYSFSEKLARAKATWAWNRGQ